MGSSKSITFLLIGLMLFAVMFMVGCGNQSSDEPQAEKDLTGSITIAGSTSVQPFSEVLAEKFMEKHPGVQINVQGGGSSQGVQAAVSGIADIGAVSRELKEEEKGYGLVETKIALDGIAVIVHPSNKIDDLSKEEVKNIYLGNITNWRQVGGMDAPIVVVCREEGSGTRGAFEEMVMEKEKIASGVIIQNSNGAVRTTVAGDEKAIGFISVAVVNDEVKAVKIDGVEANTDNIKKGTYGIARPFIYVTKDAPKGIVKAYLDFVLSDEGQSIITEEGAVKIK